MNGETDVREGGRGSGRGERKEGEMTGWVGAVGVGDGKGMELGCQGAGWIG